jgi:hypothetical protein
MATTRGEILWHPSPDAPATTRMGNFARSISSVGPGIDLSAYPDLHAWSIDDLEGALDWYAAYADST